MSNDLTPFGDNRDAESVKKDAAAARADMTRQMAAMTEQADQAKADLDAQRAKLEAEFNRKRAELEAQMQPLRERLAQMQEVMWTADLYLGRDESLRLVRDGRPAPANTPITVRQKVLVMAEESLVLFDADGSTGMDYRDIDTFVEWLKADAAHLDRVLPEPKGVVVLVPTRVEARSGNVFEDAARNEANQQSYWLLRNGERLTLLTVDPDLRIGTRLLPRRDEFTKVFEQRLFGFGGSRTKPVQPGSDQWLELEKIASAKRRHYMRIMLVLQGVVDRTTTWQPLPDGPHLSLMDVRAQEDGRVVLIQDDEDSMLLGDGAESFTHWQQRMNKQLRPGLRIVGDWSRRYDREYDDYDKSRVHPRGAQGLDAKTPYLLEKRREGGLVFYFERTDKVYRRDVPVPGKPGYTYASPHPVEATRRASFLVYPDDQWVLPYDLASTTDLERFLASRQERSKHFLRMVPVIRAALAAKQAEAETEAPFRELLAGMLVTAGAEEATVAETLDGLVQWWKVKNAWGRALNGDPEHEAKAAREIVQEFGVRQEVAANAGESERMVALGRSIPDVVSVVRNRQGRWFAYAASTPGEDVFLDVTPLRKNGTVGDTTKWTTVQQRSASLLHVAWCDTRWERWQFAANPKHYLAGPEREQVIAQVREQAPGLLLAVVEYHDPANPGARGFATYSWIDGNPEGTELQARSRPLDYHGTYRSGYPITMRPYLVDKTKGGVRLIAGEQPFKWGQPAFHSAFDSFAADSRWGNLPWWPDDAYKYPDPRPRLVWSDEDALDRMVGWVQRCEALVRAEREREKELLEHVAPYVRAVQALIAAQVEGDAKARFVEDYGPDAMDLWEGHRKALRLNTEPLKSHVLTQCFARAVREGKPVVGRALGELAAEHAGEYADIIVPATSVDEDGD